MLLPMVRLTNSLKYKCAVSMIAFMSVAYSSTGTCQALADSSPSSSDTSQAQPAQSNWQVLPDQAEPLHAMQNYKAALPLYEQAARLITATK